MKTVLLEGYLGEKYGREWTIKAKTYQDIFSCIDSNYPGFRTDLMDLYHAGGDISIVTGNQLIEEAEELYYPIDADTIVISPLPTGSKSGGAKILVAVALITAFFVLGGVAAVGGTGSFLGLTGGWASIAASTTLMIGVNLAIAGIQQLLAPDPSVDENDEDYLFNGPVQVTASGNPVPVLFGEGIIGGIVMTSAILPGLPSASGHIGGLAPGLGGVGLLPGGFSPGFGGFNDERLVGGLSDEIDPSLIIYSANTIKKPWAALAPTEGVSYISPVVPHEVPDSLWASHRAAVLLDSYKDETNWNNFTDIVVGTPPTEATLFRTLQGVTLVSEATTSSLTATASLAATLDGVTLSGEATAGFNALADITLAGVTLESDTVFTEVDNRSLALAATLDDVTLTAEATSPWVLAFANTLEGVTLASTATSEYITTLEATLDSLTLSSAAEFTGGGARTAPTFRSSSADISTGVTDKPPGTVSGDLLVGYFFDFINGGTITIPSGWTLIGSQVSAVDFEMKVAYKIAGGSEPSTYTHSSSSPDYPAAIIACYYNIDSSNPIDANANNVGTSSTRTASAVTAAYANSELLVFTAGYPQTITSGITGMTLVEDVAELGYYTLYREAIASAGSTGTRTQTQSASAEWLAHSLIINGAP
jgi:predicted phage tail protein